MAVDLEHIYVKLIGQGHRPKFRVTWGSHGSHEPTRWPCTDVARDSDAGRNVQKNKNNAFHNAGDPPKFVGPWIRPASVVACWHCDRTTSYKVTPEILGLSASVVGLNSTQLNRELRTQVSKTSKSASI